jgi:hypothetical protein
VARKAFTADLPIDVDIGENADNGDYDGENQ